MVCLFGSSLVASAQDQSSCVDSNNLSSSGAIVNWVGIEKNKPFTAERIVNSEDESFHQPDLVARDTAGRIYLEQHNLPWQFYSASSHHDANTVWALGTANVLDSFGGRSVYLVPGLRTAVVKQACVHAPPFRQSNHPYSYDLTLLLILKAAPGVAVEDLGNQRLEGFQAHGIRIVWLGTDKDGDWNGRPVRATETWRSDELGATLLQVSLDFRKRITFLNRLVNIKTVEPEAALFEIPPGYEISETPQTASLTNLSSAKKNTKR